MCLEARKNKRFDEQCDRSSSEGEDNGIEDDEEDIRNGLGNASKELAEDSSDSDSKEYELQE